MRALESVIKKSVSVYLINTFKQVFSLKVKIEKPFQGKIYEKIEYITCTTCGLHYKQSNEGNHSINNRDLAASREKYCQQRKKYKIS